MTQIQRQPDQPITQEIVLSTLGLKPNDANTITALALCQRYDLDPVLKHILIVKGNVYVTRDGLLYTAHKSGKLDGMEVLEMGETETHYTARVAVYRKDMSRPFVYPGRYPKDGSNKVFGAEMAVKVSEVMGLRRAFSIAASVLEERWDDDAARDAMTANTVTVEVKPNQHQALEAPQATPTELLERLITSIQNLPGGPAVLEVELLGRDWKTITTDDQRSLYKALRNAHRRLAETGQS
jgi:hypothetical protein